MSISIETSPSLTVVKIGGSLLTWPELPRVLNEFLGQFDHPVIMVPGGGETANLVREWQSRFRFNQSAAHYLAIDSLSLNAKLLKQMVPHATIINDLNELNEQKQLVHRVIPDLARWVQKYEEETSLPLPHNWDVTSDALALWVCGLIQAQDCYFLKSVDLPENTTLDEAVTNQLIDAHCLRLWSELTQLKPQFQLHWKNLRNLQANSQLAWSHGTGIDESSNISTPGTYQ